MSAREWPRSLRPDQRDGRFNVLMDAICGVYRELADEDVIHSMSVAVIKGDGCAEMIYWGARGARRLTVTDESVEALEDAELECEFGGEEACLAGRLVEVGFAVVAEPVTVRLPVTAGLLSGLPEVLADVLKAIAVSNLPHDGTPEARTGTEAHQQHVSFHLHVLALGFKQFGHVPRHSLMMPRRIVVSP